MVWNEERASDGAPAAGVPAGAPEARPNGEGAGRAGQARVGHRPPAAQALAPLFEELFEGDPPLRFELWDGSSLGEDRGPGRVLVQSPDALRRLLWAPGELGLARCFVGGEIEVDGDLLATLETLEATGCRHRHPRARTAWRALQAGIQLEALGRPLPAPPEEARPVGRRHSRRRDSEAVRHHYDVGNDFYRLVLGPSLVYSCARFSEEGVSLEEAQRSKLDLVCRKLGLDRRPGLRLLDVGCGWGSMLIHAAQTYGARAVGITLSPEQAELARQRVAEVGLGSQVQVRVQDYRDLGHERFDAISSIGMAEHVGHSRIDEYFGVLHGLLEPGGRLLNHAISKPGGSKMGRRSFVGRYVFPDGELLDVGRSVLSMEGAGFEVRDVESLREHYVRTLRAWVTNLEACWSEAVAIVGARRARTWRLYMSASANAFELGRISVHQVLGVRTHPGGRSDLPATREAWV